MLFDIGEAALANSGGVVDYALENIPQLFVGAIPKVGGAALAASNIGYAGEEFTKGLTEYQKQNNGALPPPDERRMMALKAVSLAAAEHLGDKMSLGFMVPEKAAKEAAKLSFKQSLKNTGEAGIKGFGTEAMTEGYQSAVEADLGQREVTAKEVITGAAIGGLTGGLLSGGGRAVAEVAEATPEHLAKKSADALKEAADKDETIKAIQTGDHTAFLNEKSSKYDPTKAAAVLYGNSQLPDTPAETKEANQTKMNELVAGLTEKRDDAKAKYEALSSFTVDQLNTDIAEAKTQLAKVDPANVEQANGLTEHITNLEELLADTATNEVAAKSWKVKMDGFDRQLGQVNKLSDALGRLNKPKPEDIPSVIEAANTPVANASEEVKTAAQASINRVVNMAMMHPDSIPEASLLKLANNKANGLSEDVRSYLRSIPAARRAETAAAKMEGASKEVLEGNPKNAKIIGMKQYRERIGAAIAGNIKGTAQGLLDTLSNFADDHRAKENLFTSLYEKVQASPKKSARFQVVPIKNGGWMVSPKTYTERDPETGVLTGLRDVGGIEIHRGTGKLIYGLQSEAELVEATHAQLQAAYKLKFGSSTTVSTKQPPVASTTPVSPVVTPVTSTPNQSTKVDSTVNPVAGSTTPSFDSILNTDDVYQKWSNVRDGTDRATMVEQMVTVAKQYAAHTGKLDRTAVAKELFGQFKWFKAASPEQRKQALEVLLAKPTTVAKEVTKTAPANQKIFEEGKVLDADTSVESPMEITQAELDAAIKLAKSTNESDLDNAPEKLLSIISGNPFVVVNTQKEQETAPVVVTDEAKEIANASEAFKALGLESTEVDADDTSGATHAWELIDGEERSLLVQFNPETKDYSSTWNLWDMRDSTTADADNSFASQSFATWQEVIKAIKPKANTATTPAQEVISEDNELTIKPLDKSKLASVFDKSPLLTAISKQWVHAFATVKAFSVADNLGELDVDIIDNEPYNTLVLKESVLSDPLLDLVIAHETAHTFQHKVDLAPFKESGEAYKLAMAIPTDSLLGKVLSYPLDPKRRKGLVLAEELHAQLFAFYSTPDYAAILEQAAPALFQLMESMYGKDATILQRILGTTNSVGGTTQSRAGTAEATSVVQEGTPSSETVVEDTQAKDSVTSLQDALQSVATINAALLETALTEHVASTEDIQNELADVATLLGLLELDLGNNTDGVIPSEQELLSAQQTVINAIQQMLDNPESYDAIKANLVKALSWFSPKFLTGNNVERSDRAQKSARKYFPENRKAHYLIQLAEELNEVLTEVSGEMDKAQLQQVEIQKRAFKVMRFGADTVIKQAGKYQGMTNQQAYEQAKDDVFPKLSYPGSLSLFRQVKKFTGKKLGGVFKTGNLIVEMLMQSAGNNKDTAKQRPLVLVKDFLTSWKNGEVSPYDYSAGIVPNEAQTTLVNDLLKRATQWKGIIKSNLIRGSINKNTGKVSETADPQYNYKDPVQFLLHELEAGNMDENVMMAIIVASYGYVAENAKGSATSTLDETKAKFGLKDYEEISRELYNKAYVAGTREKVLANALGQRITQALGLKATEAATVEFLPKLQSALGMHALKLLLEEGILERTMIDPEIIKRGLPEDKGELTRDVDQGFIRFTRSNGKTFKERILNKKAEDISTLAKGTEGIISHIFGIDSDLTFPSLKPVKSQKTKTDNTNQNIPTMTAEFMEHEDSTPNYVREDMWGLMTKFSKDLFLTMAGSVNLEDPLMHITNKESNEASNEALIREYDNAQDFLTGMLEKSPHKFQQAMYFLHSVWKQQRVGIASNGFNPQSSKLHRGLVYRPEWTTEVSSSNRELMQSFRLRVAEGLGVKTDKQGNKLSLLDYKALFDTATEDQKVLDIRAAVAVLRTALTADSISEADQNTIAKGVAAGGSNMHSLDALVAMAHYQNAKAKAKGKSFNFTVQMMGEVDGVTYPVGCCS